MFGGDSSSLGDRQFLKIMFGGDSSSLGDRQFLEIMFGGDSSSLGAVSFWRLCSVETVHPLAILDIKLLFRTSTALANSAHKEIINPLKNIINPQYTKGGPLRTPEGDFL